MKERIVVILFVAQITCFAMETGKENLWDLIQTDPQRAHMVLSCDQSLSLARIAKAAESRAAAKRVKLCMQVAQTREYNELITEDDCKNLIKTFFVCAERNNNS